jgi:pimeloyl-ACP methyl ester carboxylesterase
MQRNSLRVYLAAVAHDGPEEDLDDFDPARVGAPALILIGDEDVPDMLKIADRLASELPRGRRVLLPGVAHLPSLERPDVVTPLLLDFLADPS